ncbi:MAG: hypothetical protein J6A99_01345, partial [Clostridia bacterium]|nr:hypothetical protein [Clostridia bacterium]
MNTTTERKNNFRLKGVKTLIALLIASIFVFLGTLAIITLGQRADSSLSFLGDSAIESSGNLAFAGNDNEITSTKFDTVSTNGSVADYFADDDKINPETEGGLTNKDEYYVTHEIPAANYSIWMRLNAGDGWSPYFSNYGTRGRKFTADEQIMTGQVLMSTVANLEIPTNLLNLMKLGLVSKIEFSANVGSETAPTAVEAAHIEMATSAYHYDSNNKSNPCGKYLSDIGRASGDGENTNVSASISDAATIQTAAKASKNYIRVFTTCGHSGGGWVWNQEDINLFVQSGTIKITYKAPVVNMGLITPSETGKAGNRANLYASVKVNNASGSINRDSYKEYVFENYNSSFALSAATVSGYSTPKLYRGTTGQTSSTTGMTLLSGTSKTVTIATLVSESGTGSYYGAFYQPNSYTLTLNTGTGGTFKSSITGFTVASTSKISTTIYFDNNYNIPAASTLMTSSGSFAGWTKNSGNGPSNVGDG